MEGFLFLLQFFVIFWLQKQAKKSTSTALWMVFVKTWGIFFSARFLHQEQDLIKNYVA